jgi:diguanylate cyclase (GGDEF)-like protein
MTRSWLQWSADYEGGSGDRRQAPGSEIPALDPSDFDPVLGTLNWVKFTEVLDAARAQSAGAVLVVDLDDRSSVIQLVAGLAGEDLLPWLAQAIRRAVRADDLVTHVDGCRFAVLLRGAAQEVANAVADRIREAVEDTMFSTVAGSSKLGVAVSGVAFDSAGNRGGDLVDLATTNLDLARSAVNSKHFQ